MLGAVAAALGAAGDPCRLPAWLGPWLLEVFGVKKNFNCLAEVFGAPFQDEAQAHDLLGGQSSDFMSHQHRQHPGTMPRVSLLHHTMTPKQCQDYQSQRKLRTSPIDDATRMKRKIIS